MSELLTAWLLDSDPALRWQVERDLVGEPPEVWEATRARVATEGFGARLLALQDSDGQWGRWRILPRGLRLSRPRSRRRSRAALDGDDLDAQFAAGVGSGPRSSGRHG